MSADPPPPPPRQQLPIVLLLCPLSPILEEALSPKFRLLKPWESPFPLDEFLVAHSASIRAVIVSGGAMLKADLISALPRLGCAITTSAGVDHIDLAACARRGIALAGAGGVFSVDVADYAVGLLLDVLRRISASDRYVRGGAWPGKGEYPLGYKLGGKRVGIIGLGSIGFEIAKRLEAFGCLISYNSRKKKPLVPYTFHPNVCDLAAENDILIVACALTSETHHIISKDVLIALGKEGVIVNIGRGALIDEVELVRCLLEGEIGGAGLDVFENEPVVPKEMLAVDNVVLSPHSAFISFESFSDLAQVVVSNLEAFFSDKALITPVMV